MGITDEAESILGMAYQILHMLPADPEKAAPQLKMIGDALKARKPQRIEGWIGESSYVFNHLRKQRLEPALASLAVAAGIIENVRPHFTALVRGVAAPDIPRQVPTDTRPEVSIY